MNKKWWTSRTLWVNLIMFLGVLVMTVTGIDFLTPEIQSSILIAVNVGLRIITTEGLSG